MNQPSQKPASRIPCLDGIRAVSIGMVLLSHMVGTRGFELSDSVARFTHLGQLGVQIFFVISGYLITTLLLAETRKYGDISLGRFYFRRTFRIFPAFYVFIAAMLLASAFGWVTLQDNDLGHALTYTTNYHHDRSWALGHMWSLSVEEQFYLLWPALLLLAGVRPAIGIAALYVVLAPVIRVMTWKYLPESRVGIGESFQTVADAIATGCVLAWLRPRLDRNRLFVKLQKSGLTLAALVMVILVLDFHKAHISMSYTVGIMIINLCIALVLDWCLRNPDGRVGRLLNCRPAVYIGALSYSLYLWQQPFLDDGSQALATLFPLNIVLAVAFALASYYWIEKPCLALRHRVERAWLGQRQPAVSAPVPAWTFAMEQIAALRTIALQPSLARAA